MRNIPDSQNGGPGWSKKIIGFFKALQQPVEVQVSQAAAPGAPPMAASIPKAGAPHGELVIETVNDGFEAMYSQGTPEQLPWHWEGLDPDYAWGLQEMYIRTGRIVDIGAGAGTQPIELAKLGLDVWATDFSPAAVRHGIKLAEAAGVKVSFVVDDACDTQLPGVFDVVLDRGCLHVIPPAQRTSYVKSVSCLLEPGSLLFLKCFSTEEPPRPGPFRFSIEDIEDLFGGEFEIESSRATQFHGARSRHPHALFTILRKR